MGDAQRLDIAPIFAPLDGRGLLDLSPRGTSRLPPT